MIDRKREVSLKVSQKAEKTISFPNSPESICPVCKHTNEDEGTYCEECGKVLKQPASCPKCKTPAKQHADICEVCGTWLLIGQCMFCYAKIAEDEAFCGECGNPAKGHFCQQCGQHSIFDFCKSCRIPLSNQAHKMMANNAEDQNFKEIAILFEKLTDHGDFFPDRSNATSDNLTETNPASIPYDDQVLKIKEYREKCNKPGIHEKEQLTSKVIFSNEQKSRISLLNEEVLKEEEKRRVEEERRKKEEERLRKEAEERRRKEEAKRREEERKLQAQLSAALNKFSGKTFSSNQEARKFFMSIIAGLSDDVAKKITSRGMGWRCNAYSAVHDSPGDCADPSRGGVWLIR